MFENLTLDDSSPTASDAGTVYQDQALIPPSSPIPVLGSVAKNRAEKAHFALGAESPGLPVLENAITTGGEGTLRDNLTTQQNSAAKLRVMTQITEAAKKGQPVDPSTINVPNYKPDSILEDKFADQFVVQTIKDSRSMAQLQQEDPKRAQDLATGFGVAVAREQRLRKLYEDQKAENEKQGTISSIWYFGKQVLPLTSAVNKTDNLGQAVMSGSQMLKDREKFWSFKTNDEAIAWATEKVLRAKSGALGNPFDAEDWLRNMISYSHEDAFIANIIDGLDTKSVGGLAVGAAKVGAAVAVKNLMKSTVKTLDDPMFSMTNVYAAKGDLSTAASQTVKKIIAEGDPMGMGQTMSDTLPRLNNIPNIFRMFGEPIQLQNDRAEKMIKILEQQAVAGTRAVTQPHRAQRVPEKSLEAIGQETQDLILRENPNVNDSVISFQRKWVQGPNEFHEEAIIGNRDGTLFKSPAAADRYAQQELGLDFERYTLNKEGTSLSSNRTNLKNKEFGYETVPHGEGFYISITKPYNETSDLARSILLPNENKNPIHPGTYFLERVKGAEGILAPLQRENRHKVTHIPQVMFEVIEDIAKVFPRMRKQSFKDLDAVLERNMNTHYKDPQTGELVRGAVYKNQNELEKAWKDIHGRYPNEIESLAYWTYHQIMDLDWIARNLGVHRDLSRQGVEQQTVRVGDVPVEFHGRFEKEFPKNRSGNPGFMVVERGSPEAVHHYMNDIKNTDTIEYLQNLVEKQGYKVIQVANPEDRPFRNATGKGQTINFVITNDSTSKPLPFKLVDYNPGVHVLYPQTNFVKQVVVETGERGLTRYYGDKTIFGFYTSKEAKNFATKLDELRIMLKGGTPDAEMSAFIDRNLPKDLDFWKKQFDAKEGYLSVDHPIHHTQSGQTIMESYPQMRERYGGDNLIVERNTEYNLYRSIDMDFLANRDGPLQTISRTGSKEKPVYDLRKAETLDPMIALQRTIGNSITSLINNDYKIGAIEQWFQQYKHLLTDRARTNPYNAFYDKSALNENSLNRAELASARESRERVLGFLGQRSEKGKDLDAVQQKIMDRLGEKGAKVYTEHELRLLKDPVGFTRSVMFDAFFGLFNVAQYPIQAAGMFHVLGLAGPKHGGAGFGAFLIQKTGMDLTEHPETLQRYAQIARSVGWKPDDFLESFKRMKEIGYDKIGREHALDNAKFEPEMFQGFGRRFLNMGRWGFNEGERLTRMTAWNTAFHEFRAKNPDKVITTFDEGKIIARADDLALNMTRASHSGLQEGITSIPAMYLTFSHRLLEQFWSGRIDKMERVRAGLTHAALFGIPAVASAATFYPWYDQIRGAMLEDADKRKYLDTWYGRQAMDGGIASLVHWATGKSFNVGQRYGPGAPDLIEKFRTGELTVGDAVFGPPGNMVQSAMSTMYPAWIGAYSAMASGEAYPFNKEDALQVFRELKGPNNAFNALMALNAGKYISKQGTLIDRNLDYKDAIAIMGGLTPTEIVDERLLRKSLKSHDEMVKKISRFATDQIVQGYVAAGNGDFANMERYWSRANAAMKTYGDFSAKDIADVWKKARDFGKDQIERTEQRLLETGTQEQLTKRHRQLLGIE